jgi:hypothetical protein
MRSKVPSGIRWTGNKTKEELLDDPLAESLFGLFLKVKDSPRHIAFKPEKLINEVYYICNRFYQDANPCAMIDSYAHDIESDMGWSYATELVMSMAYIVVKSQRKNPDRVEELLQTIEEHYNFNCYWDECQRLVAKQKPKEPGKFYFGADLSSLLKQNGQDLKKVLGKNPVLIINKVDQLNAILGKNAKIQK